MPPPYRHILILSDIEGSSGCWNRADARLFTPGWPRACLDMSRDVSAVTAALFEAGIERVTIKDFHRTGFNLLPEYIDLRARVIHGYRRGPVPGLGDPGDAEALMVLGGHAAGGTNGFLAHTLTSRLARLEVNDHPLSEFELFSAVLGLYGIRPIFFQGCPTACGQAREVVPGLPVYPIDKSAGKAALDVAAWRKGLAGAARNALSYRAPEPMPSAGRFRVKITPRAGERAARKIAAEWNHQCAGPDILFRSRDIHELYRDLIRVAYLTPVLEKTIGLGLPLYRLLGRLSLIWVRRQLARTR